MRRLLLLGLALAVLAGCNRKTSTTGQARPDSPTPAPAAGAPQGAATNPAPAGGGPGGTVQAVRTAVTRTVNQNELVNIRLVIESASTFGTMPTAQDITQALQRESPKSYQLVKDGTIVLTDIRTRAGIWAYTKDPQTAAGEHLVITSSGVERMDAQTLRQKLTQGR